MASTFSALKIELMGTGDQPGTWGLTTNNNLGNGGAGLEQAIVGMATLETADFTANSYTLPYTNTNAVQDFRALVLNITATLSAAGEVIVPAIQKPYIVLNNSVGGYAVTVKVSGQTGVSVPNGAKILVYNNGTDVGAAITHLTSLTLASALPIASGGTGSTSTTFVNLATNVTGTLPVANGGTGITSFGTGVATFLGTPSSANLAAALTDETGTGLAVFGTNPTLTGVTLAGEAACADNLVTRPTLKDYAIEGQAVGNTGGTRTLDLNDANFFSATLDQACTFTFADPPASGDFGCFVLELTNGGAFAITWPASVDWPGGAAPSLTASGKDQLVFTTRDAGTTWFGFVAGYDIK